ncbi:MAG: Flp pilus assembly complex ATPase component TadA [Planctomycetes bacterium]|nr:Flp pilus assembly complex ATPase component TadA [Planctomycetota bacterium]
MTQNLGEVLVAQGALTPEQLREALAFQRNGGIRLSDALVKLGFTDEVSVSRAQAKVEGLPFVDLSKGKPPDKLLARVPADFARQQGLLPVAEKNGRLVVAVDDPMKRILVDQLSFMIGGEVACALAAPSALKGALERCYGPTAEEAVARKMGVADATESDDAPIVRLVRRMFDDALTARASDIHVEPSPSRVRVRFRVDGMLRDVAEHPPHLHAPLVSRLKIMASMDIAEKRKPQDGRIELALPGRPIDVRVSILPTNRGETMVMRLLDRSKSLIGLQELGFGDEDYARFKKWIQRPNGLVLVTGPTGSGKTTTLYAALSELNRPDVKILTAEDPVEYHIRGINQVQVHPKIGLNFARILKAMLRAAPNIILVGEIRDVETAEIAIQASLTGHLVFSTLHTNDAPSAITRMVDMGVKPFLVAGSVHGVMAQRLVRQVCKECAESYTATPAELATLGLDSSLVGTPTVKRARGCRTCEGSGYRGRLGLFELMEMNEELKELAFRGASLDELRARALANRCLRPLLVDGARKVLLGQTTTAEVLRVARAADDQKD